MYDPEHYKDLEELSTLRQENAELKAALSDWVSMSKDGVLCCECGSGKGNRCAECGIKLAEKSSKKLIKNLKARK